MIVAAIAYRELTPEQQQTITGILVSHPEYKRQWAADYREIQEDVNLGLYLFMRASRWPDDIRSNITLRSWPKHPQMALYELRAKVSIQGGASGVRTRKRTGCN